jgi:hypothetical protein
MEVEAEIDGKQRKGETEAETGRFVAGGSREGIKQINARSRAPSQREAPSHCEQ